MGDRAGQTGDVEGFSQLQEDDGERLDERWFDQEQEGEDFEYVMLCNKICGAAHYNMQMKVVIETEEEYNEWLDSQENNKIANL